MWFFFGWVFLIGLADTIPQQHSWPCVTRANGEPVWMAETGIHRAIPFPIRLGKVMHTDFKKGDQDVCTGERFNGQWWYKDPEVK